MNQKFALRQATTPITIGADSPLLDAFGRQRVSMPSYVFDSQFTYNLLTLQYEPLVSGGTATITHDATNRMAVLTLTAAGAADYAILQTFDHFRYQPGRSQQVFITFNFQSASATCTKFVGYSNTPAVGEAQNGIELQYTNGIASFVIYSSTTNGNQIVQQGLWNVDPMDGTGPSGLTLNWSNTQILFIDFQALYVGRVRMGFVINGTAYLCHEFEHSNLIATPYIATANLPLRAGIIATANVTSAMNFICASIASEAGQEQVHGYEFSVRGLSTSCGSGVRTHMLSLRPLTTFNAIVNRIKFDLVNVDILDTGNFPIYWELAIGCTFTVGPAWAAVNGTYSAFEYGVNAVGPATALNTVGIVLASGFVSTSGAQKVTASHELSTRYPISLNAAGAVRNFGTISLIGTGLGGAASGCYGSLEWKELR